MHLAVSNPNKQKGTAFETATVEYLKTQGGAFEVVERRALHGNTDKGDISGVRDWTFELKNRRELNIGGAVDEARIEAANAKTRFYAAIVKRPRKGSPAEAFAVMPLSVLADVINELEGRRLAALFS